MKIELPKAVRSILNTLKEGGFKAYVVGGSVRDALLSRAPKDWDITTDATPEEVKKLFRRTIDTGIQHGTVTVRVSGESYEVTTFRIDGAYLDGRHPEEVSFTPSLEEDLKRRDFTVNAMAYNEEDGLVDLFDGQKDLRDGVIRAVGKAEERFQEDALRILRCVRFAAQLGFTIEHETYLAAIKLSDNLRLISAERVREEFLKILESDRPADVRVLDDIGALDYFFVEYRAHKDAIDESILKMPKDRVLRLAGLLGHAGSNAMEIYEASERFFNTLKFDNDTRNAVMHVLRFADTRLTVDRLQLRRFLNACGTENYDRVLTYMEKDKNVDMSRVRAVIEDILEKKECTCLKELAVNGKDLMQLGMMPGRKMGEVLMTLLAEVLDDPAKNDREALLSRAKELMA